MFIVGERINTSRTVKGERVIEAAVVRRDAEFIGSLAKKQHDAGTTYIDINCGTLTSGEPEALEWLTTVVQQAVPAPISFDSPNPAALERALSVYTRSNGQPLINSITAERERWAQVLPVVLAHKAKVIALAMDDTGIQEDPDTRFAISRKLVQDLMAAGVPMDDIFIDPLTFTIGSGNEVGVTLLEIMHKLRAEFPEVHIIAGLSNISHGLPQRKLLNQAMTVLALGAGLDAGIIDPNDRYLMALIAASEALLGRDEYCMNYITLSREGAFEGL